MAGALTLRLRRTLPVSPVGVNLGQRKAALGRTGPAPDSDRAAVEGDAEARPSTRKPSG